MLLIAPAVAAIASSNVPLLPLAAPLKTAPGSTISRSKNWAHSEINRIGAAHDRARVHDRPDADIDAVRVALQKAAHIMLTTQPVSELSK